MELERGGPDLPARRAPGRPPRAHAPARHRSHPLALGATLIALGSAVAACGSTDSGPGIAAPPTTTPPPAQGGGGVRGAQPPGPAGAVPAGSLKPVLRGVLDRDGVPPSGFERVMGGYVVNVTWADLQPSPGAAIASGNAIDQAIAQVRTENARNGTSWGLRLRIYAGVDAPEWAKQLGGAPVELVNPQSGDSGTVGRFWTPQFGDAYAQLQRALAARYDSVPEVREVVVSRCTTFYAEPLLRDTALPQNAQALLAAGYSVQADQQCQSDAIAAHEVWQHTRSALSLNPYQEILPDGSTRVDETYTEQLIGECRAALGARCILENNSLRSDPPPAYLRMYQAMQRAGGPITFQTASASRIGSLDSTLQLAQQLGAESVELPQGYDAAPPSAYSAASQSLAQNAPQG